MTVKIPDTKSLFKINKIDQHISPIALTIFIIFVLAAVWGAAQMGGIIPDNWIGTYVVTLTLLGTLFLYALKVASPWEKAVILRLGKFMTLRGPGLFWIVPLIDTIPTWVDQRVMVTPFAAEKTLTKDTVPVDVDAVLFWVVWDAEKAVLEVEDYRTAIAWSAQTALRDIIGRMLLADILIGRSAIDAELQRIIDERTTPWGVTVQSVEIRDIVIPQDLEDAMSRQAQAERERQSRIILGESEEQIAASFAKASERRCFHHFPFRF